MTSNNCNNRNCACTEPLQGHLGCGRLIVVMFASPGLTGTFDNVPSRSAADLLFLHLTGTTLQYACASPGNQHHGFILITCIMIGHVCAVAQIISVTNVYGVDKHNCRGCLAQL